MTGAMLEKLVHTNGRMPKHMVCVTYEGPDSLKTASVDPVEVPGWDSADMLASRKAGDAWLAAAKTPVLRVPSVVFDVERNVLINPAHPDFSRIKVTGTEPVRWDERLFEEKPAKSKSGG
jgi:RES domain-containing protein